MKLASGTKGYENFTPLCNLRKSFRQLSVSNRRKSEVAPVPQALKLKQMQTQSSCEDRENLRDAGYTVSDKSNDKNVISNQPQSRNQPELTEGYNKSNTGLFSAPSKGKLIFLL